MIRFFDALHCSLSSILCMNSPAKSPLTSSASCTTSALVRTLTDAGAKLRIKQVETSVLAKTQVLIEVRAIGLCRTDFYAISGAIKTKPGALIPGHEFSGVVVKTGDSVHNVSVGHHVVVNPVVPCGKCDDCRKKQSHCCAKTNFMGVDLDGACRENLVVNASACYRVPEHINFEVAAFAEPVAATTSIFKANISPTEKGLLIGDSRIAKLANRVLLAHGFDQIQSASLDEASLLESDQYDFVIEADVSTKVFQEMVRLIRPRGKLILKSRQHHPIQLVPREIVLKEPTIHMVNYGRFDQAVDLIVSERVRVDDLVGRNFPLRYFATALKYAAASEKRKTFLIPGDHS